MIRVTGVALVVMVVLLAGAGTALAKTTKNAKLIHVGPTGLESYNAWSRKSTPLVPGMGGSWHFPVLSPNGISVVTMDCNRRAWISNQYGAVISPPSRPVELTIPDGEGFLSGQTTFRGWLDDYRAVFTQVDPVNPEGDDATIVSDLRELGSASYYSGPVTFPTNADDGGAGDRKRTTGDRRFSISVNKKNVMTIRRHSNKKVVGRFKLPGAGSGANLSWSYVGASISPDGQYVAYELSCLKPIRRAADNSC